MPGLCYIH
uniref:Uncharacterized protein n=1 Tax=Arundo donax TaxID=35708 RepID=A0A0A8XY85_ARUDO